LDLPLPLDLRPSPFAQTITPPVDYGVAYPEGEGQPAWKAKGQLKREVIVGPETGVQELPIPTKFLRLRVFTSSESVFPPFVAGQYFVLGVARIKGSPSLSNLMWNSIYLPSSLTIGKSKLIRFHHSLSVLSSPYKCSVFPASPTYPSKHWSISRWAVSSSMLGYS
jgi:hypothetical protein